MGRLSSRVDPEAPSLVVLAGGLAKRYGGCKPLAPAGLHGEAVLDLTVSDALEAGFGEMVIVLGPQTADAITYHVKRCWPRSVDVAFTTQEVPLGTAHAVLCARSLVGDGPFAAVNADDIYGSPALRVLKDELAKSAGAEEVDPFQHAMVAFALRDTIVTDKPVTRGTCMVDQEQMLAAIVERRKVTKGPDDHFESSDGLEPEVLDGDVPVSVNLWGFRPAIWPVLEAAVTEVHRGVGRDGSILDRGAVKEDAEVLLPEVVGELVAGRVAGSPDRQKVRVLSGPGRCLGVTHFDDLPVVRSELASMVGQGTRPERTWDSAL
jgi:hypothetical protein